MTSFDAYAPTATAPHATDWERVVWVHGYAETMALALDVYRVLVHAPAPFTPSGIAVLADVDVTLVRPLLGILAEADLAIRADADSLEAWKVTSKPKSSAVRETFRAAMPEAEPRILVTGNVLNGFEFRLFVNPDDAESWGEQNAEDGQYVIAQLSSIDPYGI